MPNLNQAAWDSPSRPSPPHLVQDQGMFQRHRSAPRFQHELAARRAARRRPDESAPPTTQSPPRPWGGQLELRDQAGSVRRVRLETQLERLSELVRGWDTYSADPPNPLSLRKAREVLAASVELGSLPDRIVPSVEGGVAIVFAVRPHYAAIECFNEGDVIASFADGGSRNDAWETGVKPPDIRTFLERVRDLAHR